MAGGGAKRGSSSDPLRPQKGGHPEPERGSLRALQEEPYEPVRNRDTACGRDTDSNQEEDAGLEGPPLTYKGLSRSEVRKRRQGAGPTWMSFSPKHPWGDQ